MKDLLLPKHFLMLFLAVIVAYSCSQEDELESRYFSNDHFVELSVIEDIANGIYFPTDGSSGLKSTKPTTKIVSSIDEILNKSERTSYYIINYEEGGFVILSAANRVMPILAYSTNNNFAVEEALFIPNLSFWMEDASAQIEKIQFSNLGQSIDIEKVWARVQHSLINEVFSLKIEPTEDDCYEHTEMYTVGPITTPTWQQQGGYNDELPTITCGGSSDNARVGCVPLAIAMVMRTHEYPTSYSWVSMPFGSSTDTTAEFILDVWDAISNENSTYPDYDCNGTFAYTSIAVDVLKDQFNYTSASYGTYSYNTVKTEIGNDRPVILRGGNTNESAGHAWVCDGYRIFTYYHEDCTATTSDLLHMNWGNAGQYNGWYTYNNWDPPGAGPLKNMVLPRKFLWKMPVWPPITLF